MHSLVLLNYGDSYSNPLKYTDVGHVMSFNLCAARISLLGKKKISLNKKFLVARKKLFCREIKTILSNLPFLFSQISSVVDVPCQHLVIHR